MSERLEQTPEKQPRPLYDQCDNCNTKYELTKDNAAVYSYAKQHECDWMYCVCPNCNAQKRLFLGTNGVDEMCRALGIPFIEQEDRADEAVYEQWLNVEGIELAKTYELTDRHEKLIGEFALALANTPDEYLYDLITDTGYEQPYPQRWIS